METQLKKLLKISLFILFFIQPAYASEVHSQAGNFTGNATPTKYIITVSRIEFHKQGDPDTVFVTYVSTSSDWDIASVSAGGSIGTMQATNTLPSGTYDKIRFTVLKTMTVQGSIASLQDTLPCRTENDANTVSNPFGNNSVSTAYLGARDGGASEPETVTVPTGSNVQASSDFTDLGTAFRVSMPITFTVSNNKAIDFKIKFDVTNSLQFVLRPGTTQCIVFPGPPSVAVDID